MANILLAWELGGGYGHLAPLRILARQLRAAGHQCVFAVRHLESAGQILEPGLGPVLQAPVRLGNGRNPVQLQLSFASLLHNIGFDDPVGLAARIAAWRELMRASRIERVVADHSPTALIAARSLGLPVNAIGGGFWYPPRTQPFPSFQPWADVPRQQLLANEALVLAALNQALARLGIAPYERLQQIFDGCRCALLTYPELDHYETPRDDPYFGQLDMAYGPAPRWPDGDGPRVIAYLRAHSHLEPLLKALAAAPARVLLRIDELEPERLRPWLRPGFEIASGAVNLRLAAQECDVFVNYGALGTVSEMLLAGKPGVLWPDTVERWLVARRAGQLGAVLSAPHSGAFDAAAAIRQVLEDSSLRQNAERFAARYRSHDRAAVPEAVVRQLLAY